MWFYMKLSGYFLFHVSKSIEKINYCAYLKVECVFLVVGSPELKVQVSFSDCLLSVCQYICLSVNFSQFHLLLQICTKHPWVKGVQVCSNEVSCLFSRGDNFVNCENTSTKFNKRPTGLNGHLSIRDFTLTSCQKGSYLYINSPIIE